MARLVKPGIQQPNGWPSSDLAFEDQMLLKIKCFTSLRLLKTAPKREFISFEGRKRNEPKNNAFPDRATMLFHCYGDFSIRPPWLIEKRRTSL